MSPEQARGQAVDKRTDIWAFGCVLYEMLTGRTPFARRTFSDTIAALLEQEPDWARLPAAIPPHVERALRRCLEKNQSRRLRDIGDARIDIEDPPARAIPASVRVGRDWRHLALVAGTAVILVAASLVWALAIARRAASPAMSTAFTTAARLTDYGGSERDAALSPDGRSFVFVSNHGGTPDIWLRQVTGGEPVRLTNDAAEEADLAYSPDGENVLFTRRDASGESIWQIGALGGQPRKVIADGHSATVSPDGTRLAYLYREGTLEALAVVARNGGDRRVLARRIPDFPRVRASWSPDGRRLSFVRAGLFANSNLFVVDAATGSERQVTRFSAGSIGGRGGVGQQAWLPDNRHLVLSYTPFSRAQGALDLAIIDVEDGSISRVTTTISDGFSAPTLSADGTRLIATASRYLREIWKVPIVGNRINRASMVQIAADVPDPLWTFASRDGRTLLFNTPASGSRNLWTVTLENRSPPRQITSVLGDAVSHSSLSPDGLRVAFASWATGNSDLWIQNVDGSNLRQLTSDEGADSWPVWSPDGESIVFTSGRPDGAETRVIRAEGGASQKLIDGFFRGDWIGNPTGTGTLITSTDGVDRVRLIDAERRTVLWEKRIAGLVRAMPVFAPDGRSISVAVQEGTDHDVIEVLDASNGEGHIVARLPFPTTFRASWTDGGNAVIVNRANTVSNIALFDHFWEQSLH